MLNAIEAIHHFGLKNNTLIIVHRSLAANKVQMDYVSNLFSWDEIIELPYSRHSGILRYVKLINSLKINKYDYIFISKLETVPKLAIANLSKNKVFLLDDGVLTISIYNKYIKHGKLNKYDFKELRFLLFGLKIKIKDTINLFTSFDITPLSNIEIVKNDFAFLTAKFLNNAIMDNKTIYFLGHPSNEKLVTDATYLLNIEKLLVMSDKNIAYIPHRAQTQKVKQMLAGIENSRFSVLEINMPVELYFLENRIYPTHIISYYSTALVTLHLIYDQCKVDYIAIPNGDKIDKDLIGVYKAYNEFGFGQLYLENVGSNA